MNELFTCRVCGYQKEKKGNVLFNNVSSNSDKLDKEEKSHNTEINPA